jgi:hypothetical protein
MDIQNLIADISSRDTQKVWSASCEIIAMGQDPSKIKPLIPFLSLIKEKTKGLDRCARFVNKSGKSINNVRMRRCATAQQPRRECATA